MVRSRDRSERVELIELLARITGETVPEHDKLRRLIRILIDQRDQLQVQCDEGHRVLSELLHQREYDRYVEQAEDEMKTIARLNAIIATYQQVTGWSPELVQHYATCDLCVPICGHDEETCDRAQYAIYVLTWRDTSEHKLEFRTHQDLLNKLEEVQYNEQTELVQVSVRYVTIGDPDFDPAFIVKERV